MRVKAVDEDGITGEVGVVQVNVPRIKIDGQLHFDAVTNCYRLNNGF